MHRVLVSPDAPTVSLKLAASLRELLAGPPSVHITIKSVLRRRSRRLWEDGRDQHPTLV